MSEFNLSKKRENVFKTVGYSYPEKDIKEFIKELKEELCSELLNNPISTEGSWDRIPQEQIHSTICKLAGKKLK